MLVPGFVSRIRKADTRFDPFTEVEDTRDLEVERFSS